MSCSLYPIPLLIGLLHPSPSVMSCSLYPISHRTTPPLSLCDVMFPIPYTLYLIGLLHPSPSVMSCSYIPYVYPTGLLHPSPPVMSCCLRTLRTLYSSSHTPLNPDPIFQDISVSRKLVSLLSEPHPLAQSAAVVLAEACQVSEKLTVPTYCFRATPKLSYQHNKP